MNEEKPKATARLINNQYVFYLSEGRRPTSLEIFDKNFFLLHTPSLGDVNYDAYARMSDAKKWEMLVSCFEVICEVMQNNGKVRELEDRLNALESKKGKKNG